MENINITYDILFDVLRYEKTREELQPLDPEFFNHLVEYIQGKEQILLNSQTPVSERELTRIQLNNIRKIIIELIERREKKIMNLAIYRVKTGSEMINTTGLLKEEKPLFENLVKLLHAQKNSLTDNILNAKTPSPLLFNISDSREMQKSPIQTINPEQVISIRFIKPVPKFLGPELEIYGPFEAEDIAALPGDIAQALVNKNRAEIINLN